MAKPYYEHAGITIYHGDRREILPRPQYLIQPPACIPLPLEELLSEQDLDTLEVPEDLE